LAEEFGFVVGVEMDREARQGDNRFQFVQGDGCCLPVLSSSFDVVLLNHVLDHVSSPQQLLDEAWRVLKPGGICYLAVPNRFILIEPHYLLPFLSWLPRPLANLYVRMAGRGQVYLDHMPSYCALKKLTRRFCVEDKTVLVFKHPENFFPDDPKLYAQARWSQWIPDWLVKILLPVFPVWILILRKRAPGWQPAALTTKPREEKLAEQA
jgi:SAM-dependent methyltransferase